MSASVIRYLAPTGEIVTMQRHMRLDDAVQHLRSKNLRLTGEQIREGNALLYITRTVQ